MKRFHVHMGVKDLAESIHFYSTVFGAPPTVVKPDYAKWMIEDPRVNFAISTRGAAGIDHLGLQVDSDGELARLREQMAAADRPIADEKAIACCYARSNKHWIVDPSGIAWESFHSLGTVPTYRGESADRCCP